MFTAVRTAPSTFMETSSCPRPPLPRTGPCLRPPSPGGSLQFTASPPRALLRAARWGRSLIMGGAVACTTAGLPPALPPKTCPGKREAGLHPDPGHLQEASTSFSPRGTNGGTQKITGQPQARPTLRQSTGGTRAHGADSPCHSRAVSGLRSMLKGRTGVGSQGSQNFRTPSRSWSLQFWKFLRNTEAGISFLLTNLQMFVIRSWSPARGWASHVALDAMPLTWGAAQRHLCFRRGHAVRGPCSGRRRQIRLPHFPAPSQDCRFCSSTSLAGA